MNQKEKKKFLQGLASGVAGSMIICLIALFIYLSGVDVPELPTLGPTATPTSIPGTGSNVSLKGDVFGNISNDKLLKKLAEINKMLDESALYGVDDDKKIDGILEGLLSSLDDGYAAYYNKDNMDSLMESTNGTYCGVGILVSQNVNTGIITVVRPFKGGPAAEAGMQKDDIIIAVNSMDVTAMELSEVVTYMKGEEGTEVTITVVRDGKNMDLTMKRARIEVPTVEYEMLDNKIGYVQVTEFDDVTIEQFKRAISDLEKQGMVAMVIDLRDNPGGLVNTAVKMADRIVPTGVVVYTQDKNGVKKNEYATTAQEMNIPIALLVNENSASASEIFTGALRDYEKAIVVGTQTYGKGIVQVVATLSDGSGAKFTIAEYFTPSGYAVHGKGITPDVVVELDEELKKLSEIPKDKDNQLKAAVDELLKKIK